MDAIELLPKVLQEVTVCCEQLGDLNQAAMFKNFERQYYETVLMRHQLDLIGLLRLDRPVTFGRVLGQAQI